MILQKKWTNVTNKWVVLWNHHRFAKYYKNSDGKDTRTLIKAYGIRFDVLVYGEVSFPSKDSLNFVNDVKLVHIMRLHYQRTKPGLFKTYVHYVFCFVFCTGKKIELCNNNFQRGCILVIYSMGMYNFCR